MITPGTMSLLSLARKIISQPNYFTKCLNCQARKFSHERKFVPRRAALYVPGNDERKLKKIEGLDIDCVVMDCEDGVALNRKVKCKIVDPVQYITCIIHCIT